MKRHGGHGGGSPSTNSSWHPSSSNKTKPNAVETSSPSSSTSNTATHFSSSSSAALSTMKSTFPITSTIANTTTMTISHPITTPTPLPTPPSPSTPPYVGGSPALSNVQTTSSSLSKSGRTTPIVEVATISVAATLFVVFLVPLTYWLYRRRRGTVKQTGEFVGNDIPHDKSMRESNEQDYDYSSLRTNQSRRRLLHPDVVAPIYSFHTLPTDEGWTTDMVSATEASSSPPPSSLVPLPSTVAGKHEITTYCSTLVGNTPSTIIQDDNQKPTLRPRVANGLQENADILRQQFEMMKEQIEFMQARLTDLTKGAGGTRSIASSARDGTA